MDMLSVLPIIAIVSFVGIVAFNVGQMSKSHPTEDEMMQRLIQARLARKMAGITSDDVHKEIEQAANRLAEKTS